MKGLTVTVGTETQGGNKCEYSAYVKERIIVQSLENIETNICETVLT